MKLVTAFLRLVRWPNLVFIVVTQLLFYYCIVASLIKAPVDTHFSFEIFILLIIASVLIAAAGYIINDYFDLNIDKINKPEKLVVDKVIKRRWAIVWHIALSLIGILLGFYIDFSYGSYWTGFSNLICVVLLFGYSVSLKKKLLIGNVLISAFTSWVIIVVFLCYHNSFYSTSVVGFVDAFIVGRLFKLAVLYSGFAFIISLIREVIKDMEDMEGDAKYGCKTMPIVWGIPASKVFTAVWLIVLIAALIILQFYAVHLGWWWSVGYSVVTIIIPLLWILRKLYQAKVAKDYHQLSSAVKLVMLAGILSMSFFRLYA
jgi:4-hydroxybenzoate polyprenyltransferase